MASQMSDAEIEELQLKLDIKTKNKTLIQLERLLSSMDFCKVYNTSNFR